MKNIRQKFSNFLNNSNTENIFLTNLILTIISVPCLQFDSDLIECNSIILDDNPKSKYSLLTVIKYLALEITNQISSDNDYTLMLSRRIQEMKAQNEDKPNQSKIKSSTHQWKFNKDLEEKYNNKKKQLTNFSIFFEFLKEFISTISNKNRFEGLVENVYEFYASSLDEDQNRMNTPVIINK